ncbi:SRPBCC family protein [Streptomyces sp. TRM 70351]|uniref:SRPBCC family protein n=1 Tax=Streptomyces sp. TRM 70351 TaxID=3116552 RepID=UPI002E7C0286|nr:SRPBCC family protein [Streptomyces sp. TRM 70351]MEE1928262.1 SRPBCC family protein [Streptomyces sp. TRM 70351]
MAESGKLLDNPAADRLREEAAAYASAQAQRLLTSAGHRLGSMTARLNDVAEGRSGLSSLAFQGGRKMAEGKGPVRAAVETGAAGLKDKVKDAVKGIGGGSRKGGGGQGKFLTVIEDIDVGVPVREAYGQWTQFQEFGTFTKGVQGVEVADDTTTNWRARIFWSNRSWTATTTEQVPDQRIAWTSEGAKGTTKGVVTFHPLEENLTRVLLVIEYYPKGLFEKTGAIWRAQSRRARLDLKHFRRFVMMRGEATGEWRGEIRDGEVVLGHDDAVAEEEERAEGAERAEDGHPEEPAEDEPYEEAEDEPDAEEPDDGTYEEEPEEAVGELDEEPEDEPEDEEETDPADAGYEDAEARDAEDADAEDAAEDADAEDAGYEDVEEDADADEEVRAR